MDTRAPGAKPAWSFAAAAALLGAAVLAVVEAVAPSGVGSDWLDAGAGVAGAAVLVLVGVGVLRSPWFVVAAGAPVGYLVLSTAPEAVSLETMPVVRMLVSLAALVGYVRSATCLGHPAQYGLCCTVLGVSAVFFLVWQPPPPTPVPIARPLSGLEADLLAEMPGWRGEHQTLPASIQDVLGADEYLNLWLRSEASPYEVQVFVTYNANAMTNIPHVPWVCMKQGGYNLVEKREEALQHPTEQGREMEANTLLFEPRPGMASARALMFQYFNVGGRYIADREVARVYATSGAIGREGSYLSQTQVSVYLPPGEADGALERDSRPYALGLTFVRALVPLLEQRYYPDLGGSGGG